MHGAEKAAMQEEALLRRSWGKPPPQKRERRPCQRAPSIVELNERNRGQLTDGDAAAQRRVAEAADRRALEFAAKRIGRLQHNARVLSGLGRLEAAARLAGIADGIASEVLE